MCSFTCSTYFICIFSNVPYIFMCSFTVSMYSVFYMYFFTCSSIFMCSLTVSIFFYVFLHMFHVFFMCSFTDSMCFLTCSQKLAKAFRCHSYSKTIIWTVPETTIYPVIFVLYSSSITACSEKKKESSGYLTKHTTEMDILVDVIIFS